MKVEITNEQRARIFAAYFGADGNGGMYKTCSIALSDDDRRNIASQISATNLKMTVSTFNYMKNS